MYLTCVNINRNIRCIKKKAYDLFFNFNFYLDLTNNKINNDINTDNN